MIDVHAPHESVHTWKDFFIHIATIVIGLLIAIGLEQTVEAIHHHHQRELLQADLHEESVKNIQMIDHDLHIAAYEAWYDHASAAVSQPTLRDLSVSLPAIPCIPGSFANGFRTLQPSEGAWITALSSGTASLLPAATAQIYYRRAILVQLVVAFQKKLHDNCTVLYAMQHRFGRASAGDHAFTWTLSPQQSESFATLASEESADLKGYCFRLRYLRAFEQDLLDGGHRINGAPVDSTIQEDLLDPEDRGR